LQSPNLPSLGLVVAVADIGFDIGLVPAIAHSPSDLSKQSWGDSSTPDCRCWSRDCFALKT
jgi:hypothetical protein